MKVILLKEAEYELDTAKYTALPNDIFTMLVRVQYRTPNNNHLPRVIIFENKEEYLSKSERYEIDVTKDVLVSNKGKILCYLKEMEETDVVSTNIEKDN